MTRPPLTYKPNPTKRADLMTIPELIAEWRLGCSIAGEFAASRGIGPADPALCPGCTTGLIEAIERLIGTPPEQAL